jgi:hypothetical protein
VRCITVSASLISVYIYAHGKYHTKLAYILRLFCLSHLSLHRRLDMTVEETLEHTVSAHEQLTKYYEWVQGNRWLMLKVFAALIAFAVIFVVFVQ